MRLQIVDDRPVTAALPVDPEPDADDGTDESAGEVEGVETDDEEAEVDARAGKRWVLMVEGIPTGDGRFFEEGSVEWRDLPQPFMATDTTSEFHLGARMVGHITAIERLAREGGGNDIVGWTTMIESADPEVQNLQAMIERGDLPWVSVDCENAEGEFELPMQDQVTETPDKVIIPFGGEADGVARFTAARLIGATAVPMQAFQEAKQQDLVASLMAGSFSTIALPALVADAEEAVTDLHAALAEFGDVSLLDPSVIAALDEWAAANAEADDAEESTEVDEEDNLIASIKPPAEPPTAWFGDPKLTGPTEFTVTDEGEMWGHVAIFDSCHIGFTNECVTAPRSKTNYAAFLTGELVTADGDRVKVGQITVNSGHADMAASPRLAKEHYDHTGWAAADVACGEDEFGIWVHGAVRPHLEPAQMREFMAAPPSGDWRKINGNLEMVGVAAVNVPGFMTTMHTRARVASGAVQTLIAAAVKPCSRSAAEQAVADRIAASIGRHPMQLAAQRDAIAQRLGRDPESRRAALAARVRS